MARGRKLAVLAAVIIAGASAHVFQMVRSGDDLGRLSVMRQLVGGTPPRDDSGNLPHDPTRGGLRLAALPTIAAPTPAVSPRVTSLPAAHSEGPFGTGCAPALALTPEEGGLVRLQISAPCAIGRQVHVSWGPLALELTVSSRGTASALLPAARNPAPVRARIDGEASLTAASPAPRPTRAVAVTGAIARFAMPAPGADGKLAAAPAVLRFGTPEAGIALLRPTAGAAAAGAIDIAVTAENCDRVMRGAILAPGAGELGEIHSLELAMPPCPAAGERLRLPLPAPRSARIAAR